MFLSLIIVISLLSMVGIAVQMKISCMFEYKRMGGNLKIVKNLKHFHFGYVTKKCECEKEVVFNLLFHMCNHFSVP
jgi:hypothetical protein